MDAIIEAKAFDLTGKLPQPAEMPGTHEESAGMFEAGGYVYFIDQDYVDAMQPGVEYLYDIHGGSSIVVKKHGDQLIARKLESFHRLSDLR